MSQWTDDHLVELLHESFVAHEAQVDPVRAREIALDAGSGSRRTRLAVLAAVAVLVLFAGGLSLLRPDPGTPTPAAPTVPPPPRAATAGHNRAAASREAARLLSRVPVPPGAVGRDASPTPALRHLQAYDQDVDTSLSRTRFWVVPMRWTALVHWYVARTPADLASTLSDSTTPAPQAVFDWESGKPTSAYTQPAVVVAYDRIDARHTGLRIDVTLAARYARTARTFVPASSLTSATVTSTTYVRPPDRRSATVDDPQRLAAIAAAYNALDAAPAGSDPHPCGSPGGDERRYAVSFSWPGHELEVGFGQALCGIGRDLTLDGHPLPQQVESYSPALDQVLKAAFTS